MMNIQDENWHDNRYEQGRIRLKHGMRPASHEADYSPLRVPFGSSVVIAAFCTTISLPSETSTVM